MIRVGSASNYSFVVTTAGCCLAGFSALYAYYYYNSGSYRRRLTAPTTEVHDSEFTYSVKDALCKLDEDNETQARLGSTTNRDNTGLVPFSSSRERNAGLSAGSKKSLSQLPQLNRRHGRRVRPRGTGPFRMVPRRRRQGCIENGFGGTQAMIVRLPPTPSSDLTLHRALEGATRCNYLGWHREQQNDYAGALSYYRSELALHRQIHRLNCNSSRNQMEIAQSHTNMGRVLQLLQSYPRATAHFQKALGLRRNVALLGCSSHQEEEKQCEEQLARSHHELGIMCMDKGDYSVARGHFHQALKLRKNCLGQDHLDTAQSYRGLALVHQAMGDFPRALTLHQKVLNIRETVLGRLHADTAQSHHDIGSVSAGVGDLTSALDHHQEALDIRKAHLGDDHFETAMSYHQLGGIFQALGDCETALRRFRKALHIRKRALGQDHILTAESYAAIGLVLQQPGSQQDLAGALVKHQRALRIQQLQPNMNQAELANTYDNMGLVLHALGDYRGALKLHQKAMEGYEDALGHDSEEVAVTLNHIGATYHALGNFDKALEEYKRALKISENVYGTDHADTAITYSNIGAVLRAQGDIVGALDMHKKALAIKEHVFGTNHADTATSYGQIGMALKDQGQFQESLEYYQKALEIEEVALGNDRSTTAAVAHHQLGSDLAQMGDTRGAWAEYRKSLQILLYQLRERQQFSTVGAVETKNTNRILTHVVREMVDLANSAAGRPPRLEQISSDEESTVSSPKSMPVTELAEFFCGMSYLSE